jgi:hypothetical protein
MTHTDYTSKFRPEDWAGRTFRCTETGETFKIPVDVRPKRYYSVCRGYVDVGDGFVYRTSGVEEITNDKE